MILATKKLLSREATSFFSFFLLFSLILMRIRILLSIFGCYHLFLVYFP
ncbi:hypothetical protein SLEP1_g35311 [Rubroshorea leprosula]|uniref:Uncharacterized protein n=1 Tax=Rubroshorea leprosula TaxID=152421 RepID=A0AAV5KMR7_9ROSI|nr:hypothetical protein SLEP1_g35311 [Rubroshorea leprosula]